MNPLTDGLPRTVRIGGIRYPIRWDFRTALRIITAFEDNELTDWEKQSVMLQLLYEKIPPDTQKACELAVLFLDCGGSLGGDTGGEHLYSFTKDAPYIYSAIRQTHGVDLEGADRLHWWAFCYLFLDLREDCLFSRLLYYRQKRAMGKLTAEERAYCDSIRDILDLPQEWSAEETAEADTFMQLLRGATVSTDDRSSGR